jgi:hypothetical protein
MSDPFLPAASLEGVASAFAATRDGIDALLRDRGLRRVSPDDTARALLLGAVATSTLEGSEVAADDLAAGGGDATARAALRLSTELLGLVPVWRRAPVQAIARLHALAAAGSIPDDALGRPDGDTSRLTALARALASPTKAPGLAVAAIVHGEIVASGAFSSHAGVVARAAERIVLVERGVDPPAVTVPEAGHGAVPVGYRWALVAYLTGRVAGVAKWLWYACQALARGAVESPLAK